MGRSTEASAQKPADPAVYADFSSAFESQFGQEGVTPVQAQHFVERYLRKQDQICAWVDGDLAQSLLSTATPDLWEQSFEELEEEE